MKHAGSRGRGPIKMLLVLGVVAFGLVVAVAQDYGNDPPTAAGAGASSAVFSQDQADRGAELFSARCSGCHGAELQGGFGPQLAPLADHWRGQSLGSLFRFVSNNMPFDGPGSLETEQYLDVVAFILQRNGYPQGEAALVADAAALDAVTLDAPPATP